MSSAELTNKINDLMELRRMQEELNAEIENLTDQIKTFMGDQETLLSGPWKVSWKPVTSSRIDTTALKKALPDVAAQFTLTTTTRRFTVSA
jgi:predicted phage-related endonuclease